MGLEIVVLALLQDAGGHVLVLEPHIGQQGRGQLPPQVHVPQPLQILGGDGVAAPPQGLECSGCHGAQGGQEALRLRKEGGEGLRGQGVRIGPHLFAGEMRIFIVPPEAWDRVDQSRRFICILHQMRQFDKKNLQAGTALLYWERHGPDGEKSRKNPLTLP